MCRIVKLAEMQTRAPNKKMVVKASVWGNMRGAMHRQLM
uniref:Uncharacterized protein n=1 Tax=Arundo donax TaxID=35708 RepID=A0A0A9FD02_ARUDO